MPHEIADSDAPIMLRPPRVAALLDTKEGTLAWWRCRGGGPRYRKCGKRVFYDLADVLRFRDEMASFRVTSEDPSTRRGAAA